MNNKGRTPGSAGRSAYARSSNTSQGLSMRKRDMTPTRNTNLLPNATMVGDRFLGVRMNQDELDLANHLMTSSFHTKKEAQIVDENKENASTSHNTSISEPSSPIVTIDERAQRAEKMMRAKSVGRMTDADEGDRILCYKKNLAPPPAVGYVNQAKVLYSTNTVLNPASSVKKSVRRLPHTAHRVLDAPGMLKDVYGRYLDWGAHNWIAVALGVECYLWNPESAVIRSLFNDRGSTANGMITCVRWSNEGKYINLGYEDGTVKIYDPERPRTTDVIRELRALRVGGMQRCGAISWRQSGVMTCGYKEGTVINHDVRISNHVVSSWGGESGHKADITAVEWGFGDTMCATGSADFTAKIWDVRHVRSNDNTTVLNPAPLYTIDEHLSPVRNVQFCNFRDGVLATCGGMTDGSVKLWDVKRNCQKIREIKCCDKGGVNGIVFNRAYNEMLVGCDDGALRLYRFNANYKLVHEIAASSEQIMDLVASPNDEVIISDMEETIKVFKMFTVDKSTNVLERNRNVSLTVR